MKYSAIGLSRADAVAQWFRAPDHNPDNLSSSPGARGETRQGAHKAFSEPPHLHHRHI